MTPMPQVGHNPSHEQALDVARQSYRRRAWAHAFEQFARADRERPLTADDLESMALAAYLLGRDLDYHSALERAHYAHLHAGQRDGAVRCAFWLAFRLLMRGEKGHASGWIGCAERVLGDEPHESVERGYLLLLAVEMRLKSGELESAFAAATDAAAIGERCGDADMVACARHQQGRILLQEGRVESGLALLDEAMIAVTAGRLSARVTGLMYCSVIEACQRVYAIDRSREWTVALTRWCESQPDMVLFAGVCEVHRAEILQLQGAWPAAIDEARRAGARSQGVDPYTAAAAMYQLGEVQRLQGEFTAAEDAYRSASQLGLEPLPGLALLRLLQGRTDAAVAAIRRATGATANRLRRMRLLPAYIEIMLAAGHVEEARDACSELEEISRSLDSGVPGAIAAQACGAVDLAEGNAQAALGPLRRAFEVWQRIEAPYAAARVRVLIGLACRALGDADGAGLEIEAARSVFEQLGAGPDLTRVDALTRAPRHARGLTPRELEVLRLVAGGDTNKVIAGKLSVSEKTVDRHVSNILAKLQVPSRAAATALAYQRQLIDHPIPLPVCGENHPRP